MRFPPALPDAATRRPAPALAFYPQRPTILAIMPAELTRVFSAALHGVDALEVEIEVNETTSNEMQSLTVIVGLPDAAVRESRDRVWTAIANSAYPINPGGRTTVNLAPANLKKEGPSFDLPMAIASKETFHP